MRVCVRVGIHAYVMCMCAPVFISLRVHYMQLVDEGVCGVDLQCVQVSDH